MASAPTKKAIDGEIAAGRFSGPVIGVGVDGSTPSWDALAWSTAGPTASTAASVGVTLRVVAPKTAAALVAAGLLSVLIVPVPALGVIRRRHS